MGVECLNVFLYVYTVLVLFTECPDFGGVVVDDDVQCGKFLISCSV